MVKSDLEPEAREIFERLFIDYPREYYTWERERRIFLARAEEFGLDVLRAAAEAFRRELSRGRSPDCPMAYYLAIARRIATDRDDAGPDPYARGASSYAEHFDRLRREVADK